MVKFAMAAAVAAPFGVSAAWQPSKPVEFVIPAGTGGGADQMARFVQGIVVKHNLMKQPIVILNKGGGAGAEGFLYMKGAKGDPHKIIITLSNLFTTPMGTGTPFNWKDLTPVSMLALDQFILWVHADTPYKTAKEYLDDVKKANGAKKMAGTGAKQEDQIITVAIEQSTGGKFILSPSRVVVPWPPNWWASMSTQQSTTPSRQWPSGEPVVSSPCAFLMPSAVSTPRRSPPTRHGRMFPPVKRVGSMFSTRCCVESSPLLAQPRIK